MTQHLSKLLRNAATYLTLPYSAATSSVSSPVGLERTVTGSATVSAIASVTKTLLATKVRQLSVLVLLLLVSMSPLQAETRIGFVDIPYLIDKAPQTLDAERRLEMEFAPRQEDIRRLRDELSALNDRLELEGLTMSESVAGSIDRQVRGLERRLKRDEMDFREELNIQKNNEFKKVRVLVLETIARFGKTNNYDLIVSDGVLFANKQIDVTEKILESLLKASELLQSSN